MPAVACGTMRTERDSTVSTKMTTTAMRMTVPRESMGYSSDS
jgi:hypothetical protein